MVQEAARVLRPGGQLRIVDFHAERYAQPLRAAGCDQVSAGPAD